MRIQTLLSSIRTPSGGCYAWCYGSSQERDRPRRRLSVDRARRAVDRVAHVIKRCVDVGVRHVLVGVPQESLRDGVRADRFDARRSGLAQIVKARFPLSDSRSLPHFEHGRIETAAHVTDWTAALAEKNAVGRSRGFRAHRREDGEGDVPEGLFRDLSPPGRRVGKGERKQVGYDQRGWAGANFRRRVPDVAPRHLDRKRASQPSSYTHVFRSGA
jgi:hypothetical protein